MENQFYLWLAAALAFLFLELGHPGLFFFLSFSVGAALAAGVALYDPLIITQCLVFLGGTIAACLALNYLRKATQPHAHQTNVYALKGKRGRVTMAIESDKPGHVRINGEVWLARSYDGIPYPVDAQIEVVDMKGNHLVVKGWSEPSAL